MRFDVSKIDETGDLVACQTIEASNIEDAQIRGSSIFGTGEENIHVEDGIYAYWLQMYQDGWYNYCSLTEAEARAWKIQFRQRVVAVGDFGIGVLKEGDI